MESASYKIAILPLRQRVLEILFSSTVRDIVIVLERNPLAETWRRLGGRHFSNDLFQDKKFHLAPKISDDFFLVNDSILSEI